MDRIMRIKEVAWATGVSRAQLYIMVRQGEFPAPVRLSARAVGWKESLVASWIDSRQASA